MNGPPVPQAPNHDCWSTDARIAIGLTAILVKAWILLFLYFVYTKPPSP
ncbi:MAG TPA: hypothetical protein VGI81_00150 [Tepidisphaeraceae bacterium]